MESKLIKGVIYSQFEQKAGPMAVSWLPVDLSYDTRNLVSMKTIQMLAGEEGKVPESLAIIPFPSIYSKGLVRFLEIKDLQSRGLAIDSSLTVLFDEADDLIFYKYIKDFEAVFTETSRKIRKLEEKKGDQKKIEEVIKEFHKKIVELLKELHKSEIQPQEPTEFPKETVPEVKIRHQKYKLIVCGDPHVGKTSTILRFTDNAFRRTYIPTIGVNLSNKQFRYEDLDITFVLWDIAGQSKFQKMRNYFYGGADGIVLVFDLTDPESFDNIPKWYEDISNNISGELYGIILGNKNDLLDERKISSNKAQILAKKLNLNYFETSALTGENINESFSKMAEALYKPSIGEIDTGLTLDSERGKRKSSAKKKPRSTRTSKPDSAIKTQKTTTRKTPSKKRTPAKKTSSKKRTTTKKDSS